MYTINIAGNSYNILESTVNISKTLKDTNTASFSIIDEGAVMFFFKGQVVSITDGVANIFIGFVDSCQITKISNNSPLLIHNVSCVDKGYLVSKRIAIAAYTNQLAGDILCDLASRYLVPEGITAPIAYRQDANTTQFNTGTRSSVSTTSDGQLSLVKSGTDVHIVDDNTVLDGYTFSNTVHTAGVGIELAHENAICIASTCNGAYTENSVYWKIWAGTDTVASGDKLQYQVWYPEFSTDGGGVDGITSTNLTLRDYSNHAIVDQDGVMLHPKMSRQKNEWVTRTFSLTALAGKTLKQIMIAIEATQKRRVVMFVKDIVHLNPDGTIKTTYYGGGSTLNTSVQVSRRGFDSVTVEIVKTYIRSGHCISQGHALSTVGEFNTAVAYFTGSALTWAGDGNKYGLVDQKGLKAAEMLFSVSLDNGKSWHSLGTVNFILDALQVEAPWQQYSVPDTKVDIPGVIAGATASSKILKFRMDFALIAHDPLQSPYVNAFKSDITSSYLQARTSVAQEWNSQSDFNAGTNSNTSNRSDGTIHMNNSLRGWNDGDLSNQSLYGPTGTSAYSSTQSKVMNLTAIASNDARTRFDFAGTWGDFAMTVDVMVPPAASNVDIGMTYRTTTWNNTNNTYAYSAAVTYNTVKLVRGSNASTGSATVLAAVTLDHSPGTFVTMRVEVYSNIHYIYIDDVLQINITDSTFAGPGYVAARVYNGTGASYTGTYNSFGICSSLIGTWVSQGIVLNSVGTSEGSRIKWDDVEVDGANTLIETSTDNGATWVWANDDSEITGLSYGASMSGVTLKVRVTFTLSSPYCDPYINTIKANVTGNFVVSGYRITPSLDLTPVNRAGYTSVSWGVTIPEPAMNSLLVESSIDNGSTWQTISTSGNSIPNIATQPTPFRDYFDSDLTYLYTQSAFSAFSLDLPNSQLVSSIPSTIVYNGFTTYQDQFVQFDLYQADGVGCISNYADANNYYYVIVSDDSTTLGTPNTISLYGRYGGLTQLLDTVSISFVRGTRTRFVFDKQGTMLTVSMDGVQVLSYVDAGPMGISPMTVGKCGMITLYTNSETIQSFLVQPYGALVIGVSLLVRTTLRSVHSATAPMLNSLTISVRSPDIESGPVVSEAFFNYRHLNDCVESLCTVSNNYWNINDDGGLIFKNGYYDSSPFIVTSDNAAFDGLSYGQSAPNFRNKQYIAGAMGITDTQYIKVYGDEITTQWTMYFPLALPPRIYVNSKLKAVGLKGTDTGKDFYWAENDPNVYQDVNAVVYKKKDKIEFYYQGYYELVIVAQDDNSIADRASIEGGTTGIVEEVGGDPDVKTYAGGYQSALSQLAEYVPIGDTLNFKIDRNGLEPGQVLTVYLPEMNIIDQQYIIETVTITDEESYLWYTIKCTNGPISDSWQKSFGKLIKPKKVDVIKLGTTGSTINVPITSTADSFSWAESVSETVTSCPVPSATTYCGSSMICC